MINRSSFIKTLAVVITIGGLSVGCGPKVDMIKKQVQEEAQASFNSEKADLTANKDRLMQQLDDSKAKLAEKDSIIQKLEEGIAALSKSEQ